MALNSDVIAKLKSMLSEERLNRLVHLTGSTETAIELHQETLRLGASLMVIIATIEIALRNSVCKNLYGHFNKDDWLLQPPAPFQWRGDEMKKINTALDNARRAEYAKLSQSEKHALDHLAYPQGRPASESHLGRAKNRRKHISVSHGKIIAELTLYFWKKLYGPDYEQTLWRESLKRTFPHKKLKRADIAAHLEHIYQTRNRLAHHEPVLHNRFKDTMKSINFVTQHLEASAPSDKTPLAQLLSADLISIEMKGQEIHEKLASFSEKRRAPQQ